MATPASPQPSRSIETAPQANSLRARARLAGWVVLGSFTGIFLMVGTLLVMANPNTPPAVNDTAKNLFNAVLPVFAGWTGTVLAYYFSAATQERTSDSLDKAINKTDGGGSDSTTVSEVMIAYQNIKELIELDKTPPDAITLEDMNDRFRRVERLVFVDKHAFKYVVHSGTFRKFRDIQGAAQPTGQAMTFKNMLDDAETLTTITKLLVFVPASTTLSQAKAAMEAVTGATDIIVTGSGKQDAPMLGWLTDSDLTRNITAR
jgi:hypothetical protein